MTASTSTMSSAIRASTEAVLEEEAVKAGREEWADYRKQALRAPGRPGKLL
jgi:hypothetical protein